MLDALAGGGAYFFRTLADAVGSTDDQALTQTLWDLVWSGHLSNDTLAPLRALLAGGRTAHRPRRSAPRSTRYSGRASTLGALSGRRPASGRPAMPSRTGPPTAAGRWSLLPPTEPDATVRSYATAEVLLDRYGVVTRGSVVAEGVVGGFAGVYRVLAAAEESGRVRRGYFVEGLGAAQFATGGAVDRLRAQSRPLPDGREDDIAPPQPSHHGRPGQAEGARPTGPGRWCWPPPTRRTPTVPRSPGPSAGVRPPVTAPAQGRRAGRPRRRRAGALRRAGWQDAAVLHRRPGAAAGRGRRARARRPRGRPRQDHGREGRRRIGSGIRPPPGRCAGRGRVPRDAAGAAPAPLTPASRSTVAPTVPAKGCPGSHRRPARTGAPPSPGCDRV